jgi:hypothetical protein
MKLYVKGTEINDISTFNIDTIDFFLAKSMEDFRVTGSEASARECKKLYEIKKKFKEWTKKTN